MRNSLSVSLVVALVLFIAVSVASVSAYVTPGVIARSGSPNTLCSVVADDAWNFNDLMVDPLFPNSFVYESSTDRSSFFCGPDHGFDCPTHISDDGPLGDGAAYFDDPGGTIFPEMRANYTQATQDCSQEGELTVAYHIKPMTDRTNFGAIGAKRTFAVSRAGAFFSGLNQGFIGANDDRICINIAGVVDLAGATDGPAGCGDVAGFGNWGKGANTENDPGDNNGVNLQFDTWHHVVFTFADEDNVGAAGGNDGRYRVYVDGVLINTLDNAIDGLMPNTTNRWVVGGTVTPDITTFMIDNLQFECVEWDLARVNDADECAIPD